VQKAKKECVFRLRFSVIFRFFKGYTELIANNCLQIKERTLLSLAREAFKRSTLFYTIYKFMLLTRKIFDDKN